MNKTTQLLLSLLTVFTFTLVCPIQAQAVDCSELGALAEFDSRCAQGSGSATGSTPSPEEGIRLLQQAFQNQQSDVQVRAVGEVIRVLADDREGSQHQRFIVRVASGQTLLIAHNIDLAPRVNSLSVGDRVEFYGEYEWNAQGGVIHWTHHDPAGRHVGGWIRHNGKVYQ
ncbi:DUF3465 domain-containing protein [Roseofilum sp. BLCC_M154]|uniref:DUF3465 domain-containing protein n=1 Tax=Roseofilum acuticapitatum BLCC-M154 TaxID=3022444 RepID=A0ABT7AV84_9CYAN|nr:DUF3465 domain-containing protein [Roseofilum acuticapitatum]MDJ1170801.1 DUF3465 domain-containing protein [Roseofilum acuticapitatum BLCC-M154]